MTKLFPNAKVNLGLRITGRRVDGYHELYSIFYPLTTLTDEMIIEESDEFSVTYKNAYIAPKADLLSKIYHEYCERAGINKCIKVTVIKNIPIGSGLGGGSSDAVSFLLWLNKNVKLLDQKQNEEIAIKIGADLPFFLFNRPAIVRGIGEKIETLPTIATRLYVIVVFPNFSVSTAWAYSEYDKISKLNGDLHQNDENCLTKQKARDKSFQVNESMPDFFASGLQNDLEYAVFDRYPELAEIKLRLLQLGALDVCMSGSGSSIVSLFLDCKVATSAADALRQKYRHIFFEPLCYTGM